MTYLVGKYRRIYTSAGIEKEFLNVKNLIFIKLSDAEMDKADELTEKYGIDTDTARTLILCRKLRAKKLITGKEMSEEIGDKFEGTRIVNIDDEL